ncbi:carboxypeptidase-like regulatory domain-containing protein [Nanoarchaeota archaeon]
MKNVVLGLIIIIVLFLGGLFIVQVVAIDKEIDRNVGANFGFADTSNDYIVVEYYDPDESFDPNIVQNRPSRYDLVVSERYNNNELLKRQKFDLKIKVEDPDGNAIDDARVKVENGEDDIEYTESDGEAIFYNLGVGCYNVKVKKSGYDNEEEELCLDYDTEHKFDLELY